jgi:hypothetical protein
MPLTSSIKEFIFYLAFAQICQAFDKFPVIKVGFFQFYFLFTLEVGCLFIFRSHTELGCSFVFFSKKITGGCTVVSI